MRPFRPNLVLTPRPWDYHPDHRYTSILVQCGRPVCGGQRGNGYLGAMAASTASRTRVRPSLAVTTPSQISSRFLPR